MSDSSATRRDGLEALVDTGLMLVLAVLLLVPLGLRAANRARNVRRLPPTYLPAMEGPRDRYPFDVGKVPGLKSMNPAYVFIGDSMMGSRIDPSRLSQLTGESVAVLKYAASGPACWYLILKNWVIASGIHPRRVFIFFRDTNLTNVLFRIDANGSLDLAAHEREDELNAIVARRLGTAFHRVRDEFDGLYGASEARRWIEPAVTEWPARLILRSERRRAAFLQLLNERLGLAHLRPMVEADMQAVEDREADFDQFVDKSTLPLMLSGARTAGLTLCFVRVQRRPTGGRPPSQSRALQRYTAKLKTYIEEQGGVLIDDRGDPASTIDMYEDGDHLSDAGRARYTELFAARLQQASR